MGGTAATRARRRYRRARRLRSERRGVVAVIGTLLALLVFFALFGIFLTQYVPLWMTDNEAQFTNSAATSFAQFKGGIDTQYALGLPPILGTSFTTSSGGIPLIAQPTEGVLSFLPQSCPGGFNSATVLGLGVAGQPTNPNYCAFENQTLSTGSIFTPQFFLSAASGVLQMQLPNRYYSSETFYFEDDGVIQSQSQGFQVMAFSPPFNVTHVSGNTTVTSSFLQLYGNATTVIAQGSEEVYSHLLYTQQITSNVLPPVSGTTVRPFNYTMEIGTQFPCAWSRFLWSQMNASGLKNTGTAASTPGSYNFTWDNVSTGHRVWQSTVPQNFGSNGYACYNPGGRTWLIELNLYEVTYANLFYAGANVDVGVGGV
jgi:hypothetical protein